MFIPTVVRRLAFAATFVLLPGAFAQAESIDCGSTTQGGQDSVCSATRAVIGNDLSIFSFSVEIPGTYELVLTDYGWPENPLADLSLLLSTSSSVLGSLGQTGALRFFAAAGNHFVQARADAGSPAAIGLYGIDVTLVNPVPLPAASLLLLSGLLALAVVLQRRDPREAGPALQPA